MNVSPVLKVAKSTAETLDERGHNDDQTSSAEKEMQAKAFESIVALLLDAGYYRARIATLSEFDKAVGGLCWAITTSVRGKIKTSSSHVLGLSRGYKNSDVM